MAVLGFLAALAAPGISAVGFFVWDKVWTGSALLLNVIKGLLASVVFFCIIVVTSLALRQSAVPEATPVQFIMVWVSSIIGIVLGDTCWLASLSCLGARRVILVDAIRPFLAAGLAALMLNESPSWQVYVGMAITIVGVLLVALERAPSEQKQEIPPPGLEENPCESPNGAFDLEAADEEIQVPEKDAAGLGQRSPATTKTPESRLEELAVDEDIEMRERSPKDDASQEVADLSEHAEGYHLLLPNRRLALGYVLAVAHDFLDILGAVLVKEYGKEMSTWQINLLRFGSAGIEILAFLVALALVFWVLGRPTPAVCEVPELGRRGWAFLCLGILFVTIMAPSLNQYAIFQLNLAVYVTLTSMGPIWALPIGLLVKRERVTVRSALGSLIAVGGIIPLAFTTVLTA